ncbi:MAG: YbhB/YbcL family Raf kinase inhibitor-like protein, partial [Burkholderiales bacterium]
AWRDVPPGTRSRALLCHDPDVPARGDDVNHAGRGVPASLARGVVFNWVGVDLPGSARGFGRGAHADGVVARGKPGPAAPDGARHGANDYTGWFAADAAMSGNYFGYDGPCPPWNDAIVHRYVFTLYALDVPTLAVSGAFTGSEARAAMKGHVLAEAATTGRYTLNPDVRL